MYINLVIVILFSAVSAVIYRDNDFDKTNKCGCNLEYSCENCAPCEKLKPFCKSNDTAFEEFQAENLDDCKSWLLRGYSIQPVNSTDGTLAISLLLLKSQRDSQYEVELRVLNDNLKHLDNESSFLVHSNKIIRIAGQRTSSCEPVIHLNFAFLFSGMYQLHVTRSSFGGHADSVSSVCLSKKFNISSSYKRKSLNNIDPSIIPVYRPQRQELFFMSHFGKFSAGLHPHSTVVILKSKIDVRLTDCSGSGNEVAKYIMHGIDGDCCDSYGENISALECPCKFKEGYDKIVCTISNVSNGNYCIVLGFYDPRCKQGTLWTTGADSFCLWSYNITLNGNQTSMVYGVTLLPVSNNPFLLLCLLLGIISAMTLVIVFVYKKRCYGTLRHSLYNFTSSSLITHSSDSSNISWLVKDSCDGDNYPEVLLLYPRDCSPFMKVMEEFRSLLKDNGCKVYDPWDDRIYNKVVESCESWTYPFITNNNVRIILVLSECSKMFERAFLGNLSVNYKVPQTLDIVFMHSLAAIHQYFCNRFDSYQRIFVIQLDGSPSMNFEFITPATVYSIPQNVEYLINDLTSSESGTSDMQLEEISKPPALINCIAEYKYFRKANPNYLNDILC